MDLLLWWKDAGSLVFRVRSGQGRIRCGCLRKQFGSKCLFEVCELELVEQVKRYHTLVDGEEQEMMMMMQVSNKKSVVHITT